MTDSPVLRIKKLRGAGIVLAAARHNRRAIAAELGADSHIDLRRTGLNEILAGPATPEGVADRAKVRMAAAGLGKLRRDAVRALEFVVTPPPGQCTNDGELFADAVHWLAERFGGPENILAADVHRDEAVPHLHLLVLPLLAGRMTGSDAIGGPAKLASLVSTFFDEVGVPHGLQRPRRRLTGLTKTRTAGAVLHELRRRDDPCLRSLVWAQVRAHIEGEPGAYAELLGVPISVTKPKARSMTDIFISPGRGPKREPEEPIKGSIRTATSKPFLV